MSSPLKPAKPTPRKRTAEDQYTFTTLRALPHLPDAATSLAFLERLRDDRGVRAAMRKRRWTVPLLAEMEPLGNTSADGSKTLGLNRDRGRVIEVRLRTDWYDGWRDYRTVRKTLCHELAHIVHDEHDRAFWDLTNLLEKEVEEADWTTRGRALTDQVFYTPPEPQAEETGWKGGSFTLGGGRHDSGKTRTGSAGTNNGPAEKGLSMREIMARAAEERMKKFAATASGSKD